MFPSKNPVQPVGAPLPPAAQGSSNGLQEWIGPNLIFTVFLSYWVATGLQDTHFQLGLIIATALAAGHVFIGALLFFGNARRVFPYILELCMMVIYPILLGISYHSDRAKETLMRDYNFIVHSALAGVSLISIVVTYPLGVQHVQELVPWAYSSHEDVLTAGYFTTGVMCISFVASCLLYLVPVARDEYNNHFHALNLAFRLILPCVLTFIAVCFTRFWPAVVVAHLQTTQVYDWVNQAVVYGYPPATALLNKPKVIDNAMFQPFPPAVGGGKVGMQQQGFAGQPGVPGQAVMGPNGQVVMGPNGQVVMGQVPGQMKGNGMLPQGVQTMTGPNGQPVQVVMGPNGQPVQVVMGPNGQLMQVVATQGQGQGMGLIPIKPGQVAPLPLQQLGQQAPWAAGNQAQQQQLGQLVPVDQHGQPLQQGQQMQQGQLGQLVPVGQQGQQMQQGQLGQLVPVGQQGQQQGVQPGQMQGQRQGQLGVLMPVSQVSGRNDPGMLHAAQQAGRNMQIDQAMAAAQQRGGDFIPAVYPPGQNPQTGMNDPQGQARAFNLQGMIPQGGAQAMQAAAGQAMQAMMLPAMRPGAQQGVPQQLMAQGMQAAMGQGMQNPNMQNAMGQAVVNTAMQAAMGQGQGMANPAMQNAMGQAIVNNAMQAAMGQGMSKPSMQSGMGQAVVNTAMQAAMGQGMQNPSMQNAMGQAVANQALQAAMGQGAGSAAMQNAMGQAVVNQAMQAMGQGAQGGMAPTTQQALVTAASGMIQPMMQQGMQAVSGAQRVVAPAGQLPAMR
eukprot:CAMPEP_0202892238 /NCGR_PEP_ID=MMETSP1392-20130828/2003_1 /ASSEMBLY_ACC=CAM_ASM_000868 /TAXON_ID=225041 /ORGANISM="Chlamydomonas chlamydogama, Strain SAG 11-48b" /LENGTH=778 /DNA_ID=CAMNT_0049576129 /DNA_START=97 /DNA_END=2433 /DNA_ORIENTATION=+